MSKKQYVVIGIGRFGSSVAKTLYALGNDVLAIDSDETAIQEISEDVTHSVQADATDESSLRSLGLRNYDVAVVTIGGDIQASIMATLLAKEFGVKYIVAKAQNDLHAKVLKKIGADRVVLPERDMGVRVAHNLVSSSILEHIDLSADYSIVEIRSPREWHGKALGELNMRAKYGINIMAIKRANDVNISPNADDRIEAEDILVAIGGQKELSMLETVITK